jgi:hypothetical protein
MGMIASVLLIVAGGVVVKILADDTQQWMVWLKGWCLRTAIGLLPEDQRERLGEEWLDHVDDRPGSLAKLWAAFSLVWGARTMAQARRQAMARAAKLSLLGERAIEKHLHDIPSFLREAVVQNLRRQLTLDWDDITHGKPSGFHQRALDEYVAQFMSVVRKDGHDLAQALIAAQQGPLGQEVAIRLAKGDLFMDALTNWLKEQRSSPSAPLDVPDARADRPDPAPPGAALTPPQRDPETGPSADPGQIALSVDATRTAGDLISISLVQSPAGPRPVAGLPPAP